VSELKLVWTELKCSIAVQTVLAICHAKVRITCGRKYKKIKRC